jgi:D-psicose/D-tagatose/L-ribulose 3-epimerase
MPTAYRESQSMTNKVGIFYAYWEHEWDTDFMPYIGKVRNLGFDVLEINAGTLARMSPAAQDALAKKAAENGIVLTLCVGLPRDMDPASPDAQCRRNGIAFLVNSAKTMRRLGIQTIAGILYGTWPSALPENGEKEEFVERSVASMKEAIKAAEDNDVKFCLEVVNRFEQFIMNTTKEAVGYVQRVGSPALKLHLDTFHMNIEEDDPADAIRHAGGFLGHVHLGENNRRPPGAGLLPWDSIFDALKVIGYTGHLVMEPFLTAGGTIGRDIRVYRDLKGDLDLDQGARDALRFVRAHLSRR